MVYFMENAINQWMIEGYHPFWETTIYIYIYGYMDIYPYIHIYIYAYTLKRETGLVVSQSAPMSIGDPYDNSRT